ncbi:MAG: hypothetical protein M9894_12840 [Planctomycetes bacterium]|nr:hypothetical protein [Planctomycetota bacterium]
MWDYKVIAGRYSLDGADVVVENPLGRGTLQRILDHYGNEGFEMVSSHYDGINREVVVLLKRPRGGAPTAAYGPGAAVASSVGTVGRAAAVDPDMPASRRGGAPGAQQGGRRRTKADLDRLARDD